MTQPRARVFVYRSPVPLWLVLAITVPLGLVFLTSLLLAVAIIGAAGALAALVVPLFWRRRPPQHLRSDTSSTIELDPSQYHRIESRPKNKQ